MASNRWKLLVAAIVAAAVQVVQSATYYVDYVGGSDASAGTSTGAAFQRCPGDYRATGMAASTTLAAGDTVIFKGGVEYVATRTNANCTTLSWSGSAGNYITYDGNSAGTWGTGKAILTDNHHYYGTSGIGTTVFGSSSAKSWLMFKSFHFYELGGSATLPVDPGVATNRNSGAGFNFAGGITGGANSVYIADCDFEEIGYYWNSKPMDVNSISGLGVQSIDVDGLTVTNCTFKRLSIGLEMAWPAVMTNLTVIDCQFSLAIQWAIDIAPTTTTGKAGAINISRSRFFNFGEFGSGVWTGYGEWPHVDAIFNRCDFSGPQYSTNLDATGINFFSNTFYDTNQASGANGTSCIYLAGGASANIYNNNFTHTLKIAAVYIGSPRAAPTTLQTARVWNNTFVEDYQAAIYVAPGASVVAGLIDIRNNVFYDVRTGDSNNRILYFTKWPIADNVVIDYNIYKSFNTLGQFFAIEATAFGGLSTMNGYGLETNGLATDPVFIDITYGAGYQCNLNNLRLQSSSPAINSAFALPLGTTDAFGTVRPQGAASDMGYYEYISANPAINSRISTGFNLNQSRGRR